MTALKYEGFEAEDIHVVGLLTGASYVGMAAIVSVALCKHLAYGAWLGAYLPVLFNAPFLIYARVTPPEHRDLLSDCIASRHLLGWAVVVLWLAVIDSTWIAYPADSAARLESLRYSTICALLVFVITGGGMFTVLRRLGACRANVRAIRRAILKYTPLWEIHDACVRERRGPTPDEYARVLKELVDTVDDGRYPVHPEAHQIIAERHRERVAHCEAESRALRQAIEHITLSIEHADRTQLREAVDRRIAEISEAMGEQK